MMRIWIGMAAAAVGLFATGAGVSEPRGTGPTPYRFRIRADFPQPIFPADNRLTVEGVALGRALFFDAGLSVDGTVSCASCHLPSAGMSDSRRYSRGVGGQAGRRQAMPLVNLAWRRSFFWDGRSATLREQVMHPISDPTEMAMEPDALARKLAKHPEWRTMFREAFDAEPTSATIGLALEQFLLTLISQESRFDQARDGGTTLSATELKGLAIFLSEYDPGRGIRGADCFHCHQPPLFTNDRFANNGLDGQSLLGEEPRSQRMETSVTAMADKGREEVTRRASDAGLFKVPTLRNVALTAPYMHDGRVATLEDAVAHYDRQVLDSSTLDINIAKHGGQIEMTAEERQALLAFLRTLTDEAFVERTRAMEAQERVQREARWKLP